MSARARKQKPAPPRPPEFHTTPFAELKGVVLAAPKPAEAPPTPKATAAVAPKRPADDSELFLQAMAGVAPLDPSMAGRKQKTSAPAARSEVAPLAAIPADPENQKVFLQEVERLKLDVKFEEKLPDEDELKPLGGNRLRMVKRGVIRLDRQLDLHGLTRDEALSALGRFLHSARLAGEKAALVITGKGMHSNEGPVLNQAVAAWLREQGKGSVSEYAPAPRELGGSGAFVVFLRPLDKPDPV